MAKPNLSDACIRQALIENFAKQDLKPRAVLEELRVHNGNAVADVVALFDEAHCYEIKGSSDKIERITTQGTFYNAAFRRITLVTTSCKLQRAMQIAPAFWGIMLACDATAPISFKQVRKAKRNPEFTKDLALLTLWKSEMLELLQRQECQREPRDVLVRLISAARRKAELSSQICDILFTRHASVRSRSCVEDHVRDVCID